MPWKLLGAALAFAILCRSFVKTIKEHQGVDAIVSTPFIFYINAK